MGTQTARLCILCSIALLALAFGNGCMAVGYAYDKLSPYSPSKRTQVHRFAGTVVGGSLAALAYYSRPDRSHMEILGGLPLVLLGMDLGFALGWGLAPSDSPYSYNRACGGEFRHVAGKFWDVLEKGDPTVNALICQGLAEGKARKLDKEIETFERIDALTQGDPVIVEHLKSLRRVQRYLRAREAREAHQKD